MGKRGRYSHRFPLPSPFLKLEDVPDRDRLSTAEIHVEATMSDQIADRFGLLLGKEGYANHIVDRDQETVR